MPRVRRRFRKPGRMVRVRRPSPTGRPYAPRYDKRTARAKSKAKTGATALIGITRTTSGSSLPVLLSSETSCTLEIKPGRRMENVKIEARLPDGIFIKSITLRDGDRVSGPGVVGSECLRSDSLNPFVLPEVTTENFPVVEIVAISPVTSDTPLNIGAKVL